MDRLQQLGEIRRKLEEIQARYPQHENTRSITPEDLQLALEEARYKFEAQVMKAYRRTLKEIRVQRDRAVFRLFAVVLVLGAVFSGIQGLWIPCGLALVGLALSLWGCWATQRSLRELEAQKPFYTEALSKEEAPNQGSNSQSGP